MDPTLLPLDLGERLIPYREAYEVQQRLHAQVVAGETPPTILLLEHASTYTAGSRTQPEDRPPPGIPVVSADRGGRITWHGPGQVIAYPIVALASPVDVVAYVRTLEDALIATCGDYGLASVRVPGRSGVWVVDGQGPDRKVAAIGVRIARGVTMHGVALNVDCDLNAFSAIVPCGISDAAVTSMAAEGCFGAEAPATTDVALTLGQHLRTRLAWG